jgi:RNA polymerase sigma factor (TIGR02999 family)
MSANHEITALLGEWANGSQQALDDVTSRVYKELRQLAARYLRNERPGHTLEPTALVHEAYVRLLEQENVPCVENRSHFFGIAAHLMREVLVDHARRHATSKRRGRKVSVHEGICFADTPNTDLLALDAALNVLQQLDARKCKVIELRYFGGLALKEIAATLDLSSKTVQRDLLFAEAWLHRRMKEEAVTSRIEGTG